MGSTDKHDSLCPRVIGFWKRCECDLILEVRSDQRIADRPDIKHSEEARRRWYESGRKDAAEEISDFLHGEGNCACERCETLRVAYYAALGSNRGYS